MLFQWKSNKSLCRYELRKFSGEDILNEHLIIKACIVTFRHSKQRLENNVNILFTQPWKKFKGHVEKWILYKKVITNCKQDQI